jgi:transcriptional regulator with XRE-family HTH domain
VIQLGNAAKYLRKRFGFTQQTTAGLLDISVVHLSNIENGKTSPTAAMIERFFDTFGVDLYMLAVVKFGALNRLPQSVQKSSKALIDAWDQEIEERIDSFRLDADSC